MLLKIRVSITLTTDSLILKTVTKYTESVKSESEFYVLKVLKCHINLNN